MNSELLREREAFKKRAMATASVSAPKRPKESASSAAPESSKKSSKSNDQSAKAKLDLAQIKSMGQGGSQFKFGVLAKIVRHMKARHMEGEDQPLTMEDILDETNQVRSFHSIQWAAKLQASQVHWGSEYWTSRVFR